MSTINHSVFLSANGGVELPSAFVAIAIIALLGAPMTIAVWRRYKMDDILKLWAGLGTIAGLVGGWFGTYFFTHREIQRQESQTRMYYAALQASEKEKAEAGEQLLKLAQQIKPDVASPQGQQLLETFTGLAWGLTKEKVPAGKIGDWPTMTTPPDTSHDLFLRKTPSPSPP